jgi:hypothetical protein
MPDRPSQAYRDGMQFSDSTFAALRIDSDSVDRSSLRLFWLALALTLAAASAGLLAGG